MRRPAGRKDGVNEGVQVVKRLFSVNISVQAMINTLILVAVYLPAAFVLRRRAERLADEKFGEGKGTLPEREKWMQNRGLALSTSEYLPRVAALLAPLLAGPIGDLIGKLAK
jgi:hypothetical protein